MRTLIGRAFSARPPSAPVPPWSRPPARTPTNSSGASPSYAPAGRRGRPPPANSGPRPTTSASSPATSGRCTARSSSAPARTPSTRPSSRPCSSPGWTCGLPTRSSASRRAATSSAPTPACTATATGCPGRPAPPAKRSGRPPPTSSSGPSATSAGCPRRRPSRCGRRSGCGAGSTRTSGRWTPTTTTPTRTTPPATRPGPRPRPPAQAALARMTPSPLRRATWLTRGPRDPSALTMRYHPSSRWTVAVASAVVPLTPRV